jgi:translation initiation factor 5A
MADDGETKDDVKVPEGEVGEKIEKLFTTEEKDTSEFATQSHKRRIFC